MAERRVLQSQADRAAAVLAARLALAPSPHWSKVRLAVPLHNADVRWFRIPRPFAGDLTVCLRASAWEDFARSRSLWLVCLGASQEARCGALVLIDLNLGDNWVFSVPAPIVPLKRRPRDGAETTTFDLVAQRTGTPALRDLPPVPPPGVSSTHELPNIDLSLLLLPPTPRPGGGCMVLVRPGIPADSTGVTGFPTPPPPNPKPLPPLPMAPPPVGGVIKEALVVNLGDPTFAYKTGRGFQSAAAAAVIRLTQWGYAVEFLNNSRTSPMAAIQPVTLEELSQRVLDYQARFAARAAANPNVQQEFFFVAVGHGTISTMGYAVVVDHPAPGMTSEKLTGNNLLVNLAGFPPSAVVTCIFDTCHSNALHALAPAIGAGGFHLLTAATGPYSQGLYWNDLVLEDFVESSASGIHAGFTGAVSQAETARKARVGAQAVMLAAGAAPMTTVPVTLPIMANPVTLGVLGWVTSKLWNVIPGWGDPQWKSTGRVPTDW